MSYQVEYEARISELQDRIEELGLEVTKADAALVMAQADNDRLRAALERIEQQQPKVLAYIRANGFKWEGEDSLGNEPGNWQHLAFSIYSDLCEVDSIARQALAPSRETE